MLQSYPEFKGVNLQKHLNDFVAQIQYSDT